MHTTVSAVTAAPESYISCLTRIKCLGHGGGHVAGASIKQCVESLAVCADLQFVRAVCAVVPIIHMPVDLVDVLKTADVYLYPFTLVAARDVCMR